jgi:cell shape-determining protein MreC
MVSVERDNLKSMNNSFKNRLMEGGGLDMKDMMSNLLNIDPNEFRKTMNDLDYHGNEPMWSRIDFAETAGIGRVVDEKDPGSLLAEIERLKRDKRDLAAELEKTQQMLKLQYDLEKENKKMFEEENLALKATVDAYSKRVEASRRMAD